MEEKKKKMTAKKLRDKIGMHFPKGFSEAKYDMDVYHGNIIQDQDKFIEFLVEKLGRSREELYQEFKKLN